MDDITALLMRERTNLIGFLTLLTGDRSVADDLFQETCLDALRMKSRYEEGTNFGAWVRSIARIRVLRYRRAQGKSHLALSPDVLESLSATWGNAAPLELQTDREAALSDCMEDLQDHHRDILLRRYTHRHSLQALADHLDRSVDAVKMLTSRLRKRLRLCIEMKLTEQEIEVSA